MSKEQFLAQSHHQQMLKALVKLSRSREEAIERGGEYLKLIAIINQDSELGSVNIAEEISTIWSRERPSA